MRTRHAVLALFAAVVLALAAPVRAAVIDLTLSGEAEFGKTGATFVPAPVFLGKVGPEAGLGEGRYAMQFSLASLPAGATITSAQLRLRDATSRAGQSDVLSGFAGNGTFSAASVTGGTDLLTFVPPISSAAAFYDVTAFVQGLTAGQLAGFALRQSPLATIADSYDTAVNSSFPLLEITYTPAVVVGPGGGGGSAVPLPAGVWAGLSGLVILVVAARRRRSDHLPAV